MNTIQMTQLYAHIGNVIRMAAILELEEIDGACEHARGAELHAMLNDPLTAPTHEHHSELNRRLLDVFRRFRYQLEGVAAGSSGAAELANGPAETEAAAADDTTECPGSVHGQLSSVIDI